MRVRSVLKLALVLILLACSTVPITGRKQLNIIPAPQILSMSFQQYDQFLKEHKVITGTPEARMVQRVGHKIQKAVEQYFAQKGMSNRLSGYQWEFHLVQDEQVNAWCMPGGKVVVYTGILPITKNEVGLAVVLGHEIAHAIAEHGNERMSQGLMVQLGGMALSKALESKPEMTRNLFLTAYGVTVQLGALLPYSRLHESEADHLGLIFMAMAGYNPQEAIKFWERMASKSKGNKPPEFLSTHPSDETRIKNLKKLLPEAMKYYQK